MDWFSWLSRTTLDPSVTYQYGLAFARNELRLEDATHFNHEFLQSMGISIAKHRLEILKLAKKKEDSIGAVRPKKLSGVIKKCLRKCVSKLVFRQEEAKALPLPPPPEPIWYQGKWRGAMVRKQGNEELGGEKAMHRSRTIALSGPLDGLMHEKMVTGRVLKLSGPLDGKINERMMCTNRSPVMCRPVDGRFMGTAKSPRLSGPLDARAMVNNRSPWLTVPLNERDEGCSPYHNATADSDYDDDYTQWTALFQDLKPT